METGPLPTIISSNVDMRLVVAGSEQTVKVNAVLDYAAHEPFSVRATFHTMEGAVTWVFSRELLTQGVNEPTGQGDIVMWPSHDDGKALLHVVLQSPNGRAEMQAPLSEVSEFLQRTNEVVKPGTEGDHLDLDNLIKNLLDENPPMPL